MLDTVNLTENEKKTIIYRYINKNQKTYVEIGKELGITKQRVFSIERAALKKIRNSMFIYKLSLYTENPIKNLETIGKSSEEINDNLEKYI